MLASILKEVKIIENKQLNRAKGFYSQCDQRGGDYFKLTQLNICDALVQIFKKIHY
jgi:hypothetical protein